MLYLLLINPNRYSFTTQLIMNSTVFISLKLPCFSKSHMNTNISVSLLSLNSGMTYTLLKNHWNQVMNHIRLASSISIILTTLVLVWLWSLSMGVSSTTSLPWTIYRQSLYLSGFLSISFMSLTMILATRPKWLERPLGGLDKMYRLHKWTGIFAVIFAAAHWLIEMSDDIIKGIYGRSGRQHGDSSSWMKAMRNIAENFGEWGVYVLMFMLVITLLKYVPYKFWRYLHKSIPVLFLLLAFHSIWLAPSQWWQQPIGVVLIILLTTACIASVLALTGKIATKRKIIGNVSSITKLSSTITEVECNLGQKWPGHKPGQFALVNFNQVEGSHPFTIASADRGDGKITFQIKALGDYTQNIDQKIIVNQAVTVEGPYGCFDVTHYNPKNHQIWIAGGIGVTPFLAALEQQTDNTHHIELHYCSHNAEIDPNAERLQILCASRPHVSLSIHDSNKGERLNLQQLLSTTSANLEIWFCGSKSLSQALQAAKKAKTNHRIIIHQEIFEFR